jgi:hypothetical protein
MILRDASTRSGAHLVEDDDIGKLDLIGQQMNQRAGVALARRFAAIGKKIMAGEISQQVCRIDHCDHRVEPRHIRQANALFIAKFEGGGDRQRLGNAGGFDYQRIEAPALGQAPHLGKQILAQRAADAAVRHLDQVFRGLRDLCVRAQQISVDIDLGHVIDDDSHFATRSVLQDAFEKGGLSGPKKAGQDGDGQACIAHGIIHNIIT